MHPDERRRLAASALAGYPAGPGAGVVAEAAGMQRAVSAACVVLVEGVSDQIAVETLAAQRDRELADEGVVVVPMGGAQAIGRVLEHLGPRGLDRRVAGLCDAAEEPVFRAALVAAGLAPGEGRVGLERLGFFVCDRDLEEELIRAVEPDVIEELLAAQGDLIAFRTLQRQPAWTGRPFPDQFHRWLRAGAGRNLRYGRLLVEAIGPGGDAPAALLGVVEACRG